MRPGSSITRAISTYADAQYVTREEARERLRADALAAWPEYEATGQHTTGEAVDAWRARCEAGEAARRVVRAIRDGLRLLEAHPEAGRPADNMDPEFRERWITFSGSGYLALYRLDGSRVVILAVRRAPWPRAGALGAAARRVSPGPCGRLPRPFPAHKV